MSLTMGGGMLALGTMNLAAMLAIAAAVTAERLSARPMLVARLGGVLLIALGGFGLYQAGGAAFAA